MYQNNHDGTFKDVTREAGLFKVLHMMGSNFGDLDNDGWLDSTSAPEIPNSPRSSPVGCSGTTVAASARFIVWSARGGSFGATTLQQEVGLGNASAVVRAEIVWPTTGQTQTLAGLKLDHAYSFKEGDASAREVTLHQIKFQTGKPPAHHHH